MGMVSEHPTVATVAVVRRMARAHTGKGNDREREVWHKISEDMSDGGGACRMIPS